MEDTKTENTPQGSRVQPRRSSRFALSNSPTVKEEKNAQSSEFNYNTVTATTTTTGAISTLNDITDNTTINTTTTTTATTVTTTNSNTINNNENINENTVDKNNDEDNKDNENEENDDDSTNNKNDDINNINNNNTNTNNNNNNISNNNNTNNHSRVTRSLSTDSNSNEESSNSNPPSSNNGKRRRNANNTKIANKKKANSLYSNHSNATTIAAKSPPRGSGDDFERETRNTTQRLSKEAKDARKAEREIVIKKKLAELDVLERTVKDQSHEEYHKLLEEIQSKRNKKLTVAQGRHALMESNFKNGFLATKKSAFDKFHLDKLALRRSMMNQIQQKINRIEQEYFSSQQGTRSSLDDQHLNEWSPPDRPSMINILFFIII
ncbi:unnamed protein product [Cunninghamella blakesleeana]